MSSCEERKTAWLWEHRRKETTLKSKFETQKQESSAFYTLTCLHRNSWFRLKSLDVTVCVFPKLFQQTLHHFCNTSSVFVASGEEQRVSNLHCSWTSSSTRVFEQKVSSSTAARSRSPLWCTLKAPAERSQHSSQEESRFHEFNMNCGRNTHLRTVLCSAT